MVIVKLYARNIDYNSIVNTAMPFIAKGLSDKDSLFFDILKNIISDHGKPSGLSKLLVSAIPQKDKIAATLLSDFKNTLREAVNEQIRKNNIIAEIKTLNFKTIERNQVKMLKIEITVDDIDYGQTAANITPTLLVKLAEQDSKAGKIVQLLMGMPDIPGNMVSAAIGAIPKDQRDTLFANILMEYRAELTDSLNKIIEKNNIKADIKSIKVTSVNY